MSQLRQRGLAGARASRAGPAVAALLLLGSVGCSKLPGSPDADVDAGNRAVPLGFDDRLELGTGTTEFAPLSTGDQVQIERGPQGGHHVRVGLRLGGGVAVGSPALRMAYVFPADGGTDVAQFSYRPRFVSDGGPPEVLSLYLFILDPAVVGGQDVQIRAELKTAGETLLNAKTVHLLAPP